MVRPNGEELLEMMKPHFSLVADETTVYYELLYAHRRRMIDLIERIGVSRFAYPAVYVSGDPEGRLPKLDTSRCPSRSVQL
jgi:hypothetical protein